MPFALRENPEFLSPEDLDDYWSRGWFRMRQALFTTHFLEFDDQFFSAVWLRVDLPSWQGDPTLKTLKKRNAAFRAEFAPVSGWDEQLEDLFQRYRDGLDIDVAPSLTDLLVGHEEQSIFPSWVIRLFEGDKLIAAGVFDVGRTAAAGITSFYDHDYRKHSLGKYLIYLKMEYCRDRGLTWFYPGYFVPGRPRFDYKLSIAPDQLEYLDLEGGDWLPLEPGQRPDPLALMVEKLSRIGGELWYNGHLGIHLSPQVQGVELFDFPVFLSVFPLAGSGLFVVFDPRDGLYHLLHVRTVFQVQNTTPRHRVLDTDLVQVRRLLYSAQSAEEMEAALTFVAT